MNYGNSPTHRRIKLINRQRVFADRLAKLAAMMGDHTYFGLNAESRAMLERQLRGLAKHNNKLISKIQKLRGDQA